MAPESMRNSTERVSSGRATFAMSTFSTVKPMPEFYLGGGGEVLVVLVGGGALVLVLVGG